MDLHLWFAFVMAYAALSVVPGPSVLMVLSQAVTRGRGAALFCVAGDLAGGLVLMTLAFAGIGTVLAAGSVAFQALKWAGILWLIWLGYRQIATAGAPLAALRHTSIETGRAGFLTGVLNPKAIGFYLAFLPQFLTPDRPVVIQLGVLMVTATAVVGIVLGGYALAGAKLADRLRTPRARRMCGWVGGGAMWGGAGWMAATR